VRDKAPILYKVADGIGGNSVNSADAIGGFLHGRRVIAHGR
jgi:hypothetical protein